MTDIQPVTTPAPATKRRGVMPILVIAGILILAAVSVGAYMLTRPGDPLDRTDPAGARACRDLRSWINGDLKDDKTGKPVNELLAGMTFADEAKDATTPGIRAAAGDNVMDDPAAAPVKAFGGPADFRIANLEQLHAACAAAGEAMPAYAVP